MEWFYIILLGFVAVGLALFLFLLYSGAFYTYTIRCSIPASLPEKFAYTVHVGPYSNVGTPCCELAALVPHLTTCVVYYDNPNKVPSHQLRAAVGCVLPPTGSETTEKLLKKNGYTIESFPQCTKALVTEYPYRTWLSLLLAIKRVYPALMEYIQDYKLKAGPFFEIYKKDAIQFVAIIEPSEGYTVAKLPPLTAGEGNESKKTQ